MATAFGVCDIDRILAFAKRFPVFPCRPVPETVMVRGKAKDLNAKSPRTERGFHDATQDPEQIRRWWRQWPDALVGVPTGQTTGLVVVDYDPDKATQATHSWIAEHTNLLCSTRMHKTSRGGAHYVFQSKDRYQTGTNLVLGGSPRNGLDLRANGGYVIWWPLHGFPVVGEAVAPVPADLIDERRFNERRDMAPLPTATPESWGRERERVRAALEHIHPDGYDFWIRIGMALHHASAGSDEGFALWHDWSARGESYDGIEDCRYHWASFGGYSGRGIGLGTVFAAAKAAGHDVAPQREAAPLSVYAYEPALQDKPVRTVPNAVEEDPPVDLFVTADSLRAQSFESPPPIIEDMLLVGATLVHGPAKKGKSWLLLQMATTIDGGGEFLDRKCRRCDVLYVGAEDTSARFKSRLERMAAWGTTKFMNRDALTVFAKRLQQSFGEERPTVEVAIEKLWLAAGKPGVMFIDTQEVFEVITGIAHGKQGDSITRRDYQATSSYDGIAQKLRIAIVLVGHWGEIKSIEKATANPHECLNTTKARLAGVITSITLGPLPNQEPGESTRDMQLSIRSRDIAEGDQFLWVQQSELTGLYRSLGKVRDVLLTDSQQQLFGVLIAAYKSEGPDHWTTAKALADHLDCSPQAVKQMVGRVRKAAKAKGRTAMSGLYVLESKASSGYRVKVAEEGEE
jgi:hypothetical protein